MAVKFREVGNSITVTIPKNIVCQLGLSQGMEADIKADNNSIIVIPKLTNKKVTIKSLFAGYVGDYKPTEINYGEDVGKEVW